MKTSYSSDQWPFFSPWQRNGKLGGETNIPYPSLHYRHIPGHFYFLYGIVYLILIGKRKLLPLSVSIMVRQRKLSPLFSTISYPDLYTTSFPVSVTIVEQPDIVNRRKTYQ